MSVDVDLERTRGLTVSAISVDRLFGRYTYRLAFPEGWEEADRRLVLFYGENGVGKTTILQTVFHLLSTAPGAGHKTHLLSVPFERFTIEFAEGVRVDAVRAGEV